MHTASLPFCTCFAFNKSLTFWRQTVREMTDRQTDRDRTNHYQTPLTLNIRLKHHYLYETLRNAPPKFAQQLWFHSPLIEVHTCWNYFRLNPPPFRSVAVVAMDNCFVRNVFCSCKLIYLLQCVLTDILLYTAGGKKFLKASQLLDRKQKIMGQKLKKGFLLKLKFTKYWKYAF